MKKLSFVAALPLLSLITIQAEELDPAVLEKRCLEQERQIHQLEEENGRLRSLLETASKIESPKETLKSSQPTVADPKPISKPRYYTVSPGDTLSRIARKNKTTPEVLAKLNEIEDAGLIRVGQKIELPPKPETPSKPQGAEQVVEQATQDSLEKVSSAPETRTGNHVVKDGETFFGIARKYGLSVETLAEANPRVNPRSIRVGQSLQLVSRNHKQSVARSAPESKATPIADSASKPVTNQPLIRSIRIEEEIDFGSFARTHGMEIAKLNALNGLHLESNTVLAKGSELYVSAQP